MALDEAHVAGVPDPPTVRRRRAPAHLLAMLRDGVVDAAIVDKVPDGPRFVPVVPDADATCRAWEQSTARAR